MNVKILYKTELLPKLAVVVGTRPGIIKFSPVIRALQAAQIDFFLIHTGQHYSYNMDRHFFEILQLPDPLHTNDQVRNLQYHGEQTAEMIRGVERALLAERPRAVIVGGDANTNLAGALAGRKLGIQVAHLEAGLRSHDWRMPEEHNRVMIDHISEYLFAPTEGARQNLLEDRAKGKIWVTGNTIVDAVYQNLAIANTKSSILERLGLLGAQYIVATCHREENVDVPQRARAIVESLGAVANAFDLPVVFPVHPRTAKRIAQFDLEPALNAVNQLRQLEAVGYLDFLRLLANASLVLTDSGGIQEEACILRVPCVTLRDNTERPETVEVGANVVAGIDLDSVLAAARDILKRPRTWANPFGDGEAAERIVSVLKEEVPL